MKFSPGMGNIWWREGKFFPIGAISIIVDPIYNSTLWNYSVWDLNFIIWVICFVMIELFIAKLNEILFSNKDANGL